MPAILPNVIHVLQYTSCDGAFNIGSETGTLPGPALAPEIVYTQCGRPYGETFVIFRHLEIPGSLDAAQTAQVVDFIQENHLKRRPDAFGHTTIVVAPADEPHKAYAREFLQHVPCPHPDCRGGLLDWMLLHDVEPGEPADCPHCQRLVAVPNPDLWISREQCLAKPTLGDVSIWQSLEGERVLMLADPADSEARDAAAIVLEVLLDEPMCYLEMLWHDVQRQSRQYRRVVRDRLGVVGKRLTRETEKLLPALGDTTILAKGDADRLHEYALDVLAGIAKQQLEARRLKYSLSIDRNELELEEQQVAFEPIRDLVHARVQAADVAVNQIELDLEMLEQPLETARWASERHQEWLQQDRADKLSLLALVVGVMLGFAAVWPAVIAHDDEGLPLRWLPEYLQTFSYMAIPLALLIALGLGVFVIRLFRRGLSRRSKRRRGPTRPGKR